MKTFVGQLKQFHALRLKKGGDLLALLEHFVREEDITWGVVSVIGAVERAAVGFYNQETRSYETIGFNEELEVCSCQGNVSLKDGQPFVHVHITLADKTGKAFGGHLMPGTIVFAGEAGIAELSGDGPIRQVDPATGLALWS